MEEGRGEMAGNGGGVWGEGEDGIVLEDKRGRGEQNSWGGKEREREKESRGQGNNCGRCRQEEEGEKFCRRRARNVKEI